MRKFTRKNTHGKRKLGKLTALPAFAFPFALALALFSFSQCKKTPADEYPADVTQFATVRGNGLPFFTGRDLRPYWDLNAAEPRRLGEFSMRDQLGKKFGSDEMKGRISIVSFFFTRCQGICPMVVGNLLKVQKELGPEAKMVSFSVTPDLDTPTKLLEYSREKQIQPEKWRLITGDRTAIYRLARESLNADTFSERENARTKLDGDDFLHSENIYLLDSSLRLRGVYSGKMSASMLDLLRDLEQLKKERNG